jgi:redox-sensitive bicupin YhaK (pirin superfamily)
VQGEVELSGKKFGPAQMIVLKRGSTLEFNSTAGAHVFVFGGEPFTTPRHVWWNFVSSSKEKIELAKKRWESDEFPAVINESRFSRIPLPKA